MGEALPARGPLASCGGRAGRHGTTPACAGTTRATAAGAAWPGDHVPGAAHRATGTGPPPHARGPRQCCARLRGCAGTTPRMRGDHPVPPEGRTDDQGPPPHARGPRCPDASRGCRRGTTPARAGTTPSSRRTTTRRWDHPRTRGDHRPRLHPGRGPRRTTPARAGTTLSNLRVYPAQPPTHANFRNSGIPRERFMRSPRLRKRQPPPIEAHLKPPHSPPHPNHPRTRS